MEVSDNHKKNPLISMIAGIKEKVVNHNYENGEELKKDIDKVYKSQWKGIDDLYRNDLSKIGLLHSFLVDEIIKIHTNEESHINNELINNNLNVKEVIGIAEDGKLSSRIYFFKDADYEYYYIGDIHSDDFILDCILDKVDFFNKVVNNHKIRIIFLGDYVDRGREHLKTMEKIMSLKYIFPGNIFLLMGNHDGGKIEGDIVSLCVKKPEQDKPEDYFMLYLDNLTKMNHSYSRELIGKYLSLFNSMAIVSFLHCDGKNICGVHGGIPRPLREEGEVYGYISALSDLTDESKVNNKDETIISNILWSDPLGDREDKYNHTRRFGFTESEFNNFADVLGIDYLIRGHEANKEGYKTFFKDKLYCIFGTGQVLKDGIEINPSTAYSWVKPKVLKVKQQEGIKLVDLREIMT